MVQRESSYISQSRSRNSRSRGFSRSESRLQPVRSRGVSRSESRRQPVGVEALAGSESRRQPVRSRGVSRSESRRQPVGVEASAGRSRGFSRFGVEALAGRAHVIKRADPPIGSTPASKTATPHHLQSASDPRSSASNPKANEARSWHPTDPPPRQATVARPASGGRSIPRRCAAQSTRWSDQAWSRTPDSYSARRSCAPGCHRLRSPDRRRGRC